MDTGREKKIKHGKGCECKIEMKRKGQEKQALFKSRLYSPVPLKNIYHG